MVSKVAQTKRTTKIMSMFITLKTQMSLRPISFQAGEAKHFQKDMDTVVDKLYEEIQKVFTSKESMNLETMK